jgi:hypothetical protein
VKSDSLYAIDWTIPVGRTAHSAARAIPVRRSYSSSPMAKIPQAAKSEEIQLTARPASAGARGVIAATAFSSQGSSGKKARFEWIRPSGR